jgi:hypothetical protein
LADLNGKPDKLLAVEDRRIAELATSTGAAWKEIESKAGSCRIQIGTRKLRAM